MPFIQAKDKGKPDKPGTIAVRIFLKDERAGQLMATNGNRREDIFIDGTTVGEVYETIKKALFEEG